jgi:NADH-quinone oxidoreductase E subunit
MARGLRTGEPSENTASSRDNSRDKTLGPAAGHPSNFNSTRCHVIAADVDTVLVNFPGAKRDALIPILQEVQERHGYLSRDAVARIGRHLKLPTSKIYGVATFYNQFRFQPRGKFHIQVCRGTACHVRGSLSVLEALQRELQVTAGQTTRDGLFSLEVVACIGACGLAPVICINNRFHANVSAKSLTKILNTYRKQAAEHVDNGIS